MKLTEKTVLLVTELTQSIASEHAIQRDPSFAGYNAAVAHSLDLIGYCVEECNGDSRLLKSCLKDIISQLQASMPRGRDDLSAMTTVAYCHIVEKIEKIIK